MQDSSRLPDREPARRGAAPPFARQPRARRAGPAGARRAAGEGALALLLVASLAGEARGQFPDTSFLRFELGGASDVTNERFYEDAFDDTTFTGRRLTGSPEYRHSAVAALEAGGLLGGAGRYRLRQDAAAGNRLLRSSTRLDWRGEPSEGLRLTLSPDLDLRRDQSFGGDRRELRFRPDGRVRFTSLDRTQTWDLLLGGDWLRTSGTSELTTLDRNAGRAWLRWGRASLEGAWESELGYGADARAFPDSVERDHVEQHGALMLRRLLPGAGSAALDVQLDRRTSYYRVSSTRDRFWSGRADATAFLPLHDRLTGELWLSLDGYRYDEPDTSVYFDYWLWTARPALHWSLARDWGVRVGPRLEWLAAPEVPAERYTQVAAVLEFERLHAGDWWSLSPSAGWRQYQRSSATLSLAEPDLHSSYLFVEAEVFADLAIPARARLRLSANGRFERHEDPSQDASSLYLAMDLRRKF